MTVRETMEIRNAQRKPERAYTSVMSLMDTMARKGLLKRRIRGLIRPHHDVADVGCGVGKSLPILGPLCRRLFAIDLSAELLQEARRMGARAGLQQVSYLKRDLAVAGARLPKVDVAICVNMLITHSLRDRLAILRNLARLLKPGGALFLVVPSLESVLYANARLVEWNLKSGLSPEDALKEGFGRDRVKLADVLRQGLFDAGGLPTKHFLREELETAFSGFGFVPGKVDNVEYPWTMEFAEPPGWMAEPYPWDWAVVLRKE